MPSNALKQVKNCWSHFLFELASYVRNFEKRGPRKLRYKLKTVVDMTDKTLVHKCAINFYQTLHQISLFFRTPDDPKSIGHSTMSTAATIYSITVTDS